MNDYIIVLDTETANSLEEPLAYDIGWLVVDVETRANLEKRSFAVKEIFLDKDLMNTAYYKEKIPNYWEEIWAKERELKSLYQIQKILKEDCNNYSVDEIFAHNMNFDNRALKVTQRYYTSSKYRYFLPYGVSVCDTLKMARTALAKDKDYIKYCKKNGYIASTGQVRLTAEIIYRYISHDETFEEVHHGIDDVLIEKEILFYCLNKGVTDYKLYE